ncbi:YwqJ-related putative deaminase [Streptomyces sp. HNM0574]|uniref:YwqJ-related putative deaminase n=1 Tax=Streptomyces sp. HNM0574 TaxID=2714954 RepID=UPI0019D30782|nr:YwqJ-related putative deaminase [Streptomyces sp. HNM0574]
MNTAPLDTAPAAQSPAPGSIPHPAAQDPRVGWTAADDQAPTLHQRRDGILPAIAAALSVRGETLTCTGSKADQPPPAHPLVQDFLDTLTAERRERYTGRCAETVLLSRFLTATEEERANKGGKGGKTGKRGGKKPAKPKPLTHNEAKRALKHGKITARHIREDGDPLHGAYAAPCRSCTALLHHFGVRAVDPGPHPEHPQEETR